MVPGRHVAECPTPGLAVAATGSKVAAISPALSEMEELNKLVLKSGCHVDTQLASTC